MGIGVSGILCCGILGAQDFEERLAKAARCACSEVRGLGHA